MSTWNLRHDSASPSPVTQTLEAWGISGVVITERSFTPGTLSFQIAGNFDATPPFAYADRITLLEGSTVRWTGRVRQLPQSARGENELRAYVAEDVLGDLARRTFRQTWLMWTGEAAAESAQARLVLFRDIEAAEVTVGAQMEAIIDAAAAAGIEVQFGSADSMTANPQAVDAKAMTFLEALRLCARFAPDAMTRIDHTTTPPTLSFIRRVNATEREIAVIEHADEFGAQPLHDQQVSAVHLTYHKQAVFLGQSYISQSQDIFPEEATGDEENALVVVTDLRPASPPQNITQSQYIETVLIKPDEFDWWERLWPELADRNEAATLEDEEIVGDPSENLMILSGAQPAWTGSAAMVTVKALFNGVINGVVYLNKQLIAQVNASTLSTNTYTQVNASEQDDPGETVPVGLAEMLYDALNPLQFTGRHTRAAEELDFTVRLGDVLNFTGTDDATLTTARASVQVITRSLDDAVMTFEFGPAPWLSFNDMIDLLRSQRDLKPSDAAFTRAGNSASNSLSVEGAGMGPGASLVPTETVELHPFKVTRVGTTGNLFRVEAGQIDGVTMAAQTADIGSARPVVIRIYPQYDVSVYNSEFVYAATIKTDPAPAFQTSTEELSDITSLSSAGTEARCVLAYVDDSNVVTQFARGNITSHIGDDGSLSGLAVLAFDKDT